MTGKTMEEWESNQDVEGGFDRLDEIARRLSWRLSFKGRPFSCMALAFCLMRAGDKLAAEGKNPGELWQLMENAELQDALNDYLRERPDIWWFSEYLLHVKRDKPSWFLEMREREWTDWLANLCGQEQPADLF